LAAHYKRIAGKSPKAMTSDYIPAALTILVGVGFALALTAAAK
jgi:hypothetical protein